MGFMRIYVIGHLGYFGSYPELEKLVLGTISPVWLQVADELTLKL